MSFGMEMRELRDEQRGYGFSPAHAAAFERSKVTVNAVDGRKEIARLTQEKNDLRGALTRLLATPRCGACQKAAHEVVERIKYEEITQ